MKLQLLTQQVTDGTARENFQRLLDFFKIENHLFGFKQFELVFTSAVTNYRYRHGLGYLPKDIVQTSLLGPGSLTWNYSLFNAEFLDITTTDACTVRVFVGAYNRGQA